MHSTRSPHGKTASSSSVLRTLYPLAVAAFAWIGQPGFSELAVTGPSLPPVDDCGEPLAPLIQGLGRDGADLVVTVQFPGVDLFSDGVWVAQRDADGALVGETFVEPTGAGRSSASIPEGLAAALDRGPAFTLELLDVDRRLVADGIPWMAELRSPEPGMLTLEPVLGIAPGAAIHVSRELFEAIHGQIESGRPISVEDLGGQRPDLAGPLLNLFWQSGFLESPPEACRCRWLLATAATPLTGGVHLIWANGPAPPAPHSQYLGSTELYARLICTSASPSPELQPYLVEVGDLFEIWIADRWGPPCTARCEPQITQSLVYTSRASVAAPQVAPPPDPGTIVDSDVYWLTGAMPGLPSPVAATSTEAGLDAPLVTNRLEASTSHTGVFAMSRFEGETRIDLQHGLGVGALIASALALNVGSPGCEGVPALQAGLLTQPSFTDSEAAAPDPCDPEVHTSLVIHTGDG